MSAGSAASAVSGIHAEMEAADAPLSADGSGVPSTKLKGKQPHVANMLVRCCVRLAAAKAGILFSHFDREGKIVEDDPRRFGFHNLRHSLASFLVRSKTDPKTVQALLRHSDVRTTLQLYAHSVTEDRLGSPGIGAAGNPRERECARRTGQLLTTC